MNGQTMNEKKCKTLLIALALVCCAVGTLWGWPGVAHAESSGTVRVEGVQSAWRAYRLVAGEVADGRISECSTEGLMNEVFWRGAGIEGGGQDAAEALAAVASGDSDGSATARLGRLAVASNAPCVEVGERAAEEGISLPGGYWLLVSDLSQPMLFPLGAEGRVLTAKSTGPRLEKQVKDASGQWNEAAEAAQGHEVDYRIVSTMPSNAAAYEKLAYKVVDELPAGMRVDAGSVRVVVRDAEGGEKEVTASCEVAVSGRRLTVDVGKGDALPLMPEEPGKASVVISYRASLTERSCAGAKKGNPNSAHVEYPGSPTGSRVVSSQESTAQLYTWKIRLVKTGSGESLPGASFELRDAQGGEIGKAVTGEDGAAEFPSVASGTYRLVETEPPEGFERAGDTMVSIRSKIGTKGTATSLSANAEGAGTLQAVSVPKGTVTIGIEDEAETESVSEGLDSESEGISGNPKTGDAAGHAALATGLLLAGMAILAARALSIRREHRGRLAKRLSKR